MDTKTKIYASNPVAKLSIGDNQTAYGYERLTIEGIDTELWLHHSLIQFMDDDKIEFVKGLILKYQSHDFGANNFIRSYVDAAKESTRNSFTGIYELPTAYFRDMRDFMTNYRYRGIALRGFVGGFISIYPTGAPTF